MLLGKSLAHKYSQEQRQLELKMEYFSAAEFGKNRAVKSCYDKARNTILQLGYALDNGVLDEEGSKLLDFAMIDYSREVNALNECKRCLLCRKWGKLCRSHVCPESVLKDISKVSFAESDHPSAVINITGRHEVKTPKSDTKWLLCGACEQLLSQQGEIQFVEKFFRFLYPKVKSTSISYNENLYNFCTGVAFRSLCLTNFSCLFNTYEIYNFFVACRNHLLSLSEKNCLPKKKKNNPEFFIFRNPIGLYSTKKVREDILSGVLESNFQVHISTNHLQSGHSSPVAEGCFLMIILGGITVLTKFSPDQDFKMPQSFVPISMHGGEYIVPSELQRWTDIPPGVMEIFKKSVLHIQSRISEVFWGKIPISNKHKPVLVPPSWNTEIVQQTDPPLPHALRELQQSLLSGITEEGITVTNLLPDGFRFSKSLSKVCLPSGHSIVRHAHNRKKNATLLLVANRSDDYSMYVIVVHLKNQREFIYGFYLQENEERYIIKDLLVSSSVEGASSAFLSGVVPEIIDILESLWGDFGCFQGILHHFEIERYTRVFQCRGFIIFCIGV